MRAKIAENKVTVWSKTYCPFCTRVKGLFEEMGVEAFVVELDRLHEEAEIQDALAEMTGQRTVPNVFIGGAHVGVDRLVDRRDARARRRRRRRRGWRRWRRLRRRLDKLETEAALDRAAVEARFGRESAVAALVRIQLLRTQIHKSLLFSAQIGETPLFRAQFGDPLLCRSLRGA